MVRFGPKVLLLLLLLPACSTRETIYDWGSYNAAIHRMYSDDPNYDVSLDIEALGTEIEKTPPGRVPPGKAAHLGFLYSIKGENKRAKEYLALEKSLFPESKILMDRLISKLK